LETHLSIKFYYMLNKKETWHCFPGIKFTSYVTCGWK
jgi:hypothetical protein